MTRKNIITILVLLILGLGLIATVYLVQKQVIFKPKAYDAVYNAFEVTGPDGSPLPTREVNGQRVYDTNSLNVTIKIIDLNDL